MKSDKLSASYITTNGYIGVLTFDNRRLDYERPSRARPSSVWVLFSTRGAFLPMRLEEPEVCDLLPEQGGSMLKEAVSRWKTTLEDVLFLRD
jgi:hypothetical protein